MEVYDVNHPLQCGVCDKSGECELQNYTLELQVDSQSYMIPDTKRETTNWSSVLHYDPGLCIVCERCTTVCKDMIGDAAITTGARGGEAVSKEFKESMPKDAYTMWNKLQKSVIVPSNGTGETNCSDCGECLAVCPVGALVSRDFVYSSNAWDLRRVPAVAAHSSDGAQIYYEVKPASITDRNEKIYRVTNEWNYVSLDGSARFAYDFENRGATKDVEAFNKAVEALKKANTIRFNSLITNEEALMLQTLKEKTGVKLYNPEVASFQKFLKAYTKASGNSLYNSDPATMMEKSDFIISVGSALRHDSPAAKYAFNNIQKMNKGAGLYFHPISDTLIPTFGKTVEPMVHKAGAEEVALYLILELFCDKEKLQSSTKSYLDDHGKEKLFEQLGLTFEGFEDKLTKMLKKKESFSLIIGEDLYFHPKAENLAKLVAEIEASSDIAIVMVPPKSNALGVALICELDETSEGYTVGYNEIGDFRLSALGDGDLDMPAMNQQEGTLTSIAKRVVPTNAAVAYGGYELNDLMKALVGAPENTIDWTKHLPVDKGFKTIAFDDLPNQFTNSGIDNRGYLLNTVSTEANNEGAEAFDSATIVEGQIAYRCNPARQFNDFTDKAHEIFESFALYASVSKAEALGSKVEVTFEEGSIVLDVIADEKMEGDSVKIPDFKSKYNIYELFNGSRFQTVTIKGV
jgi:NADH-quinone oxidoreductase subunit G